MLQTVLGNKYKKKHDINFYTKAHIIFIFQEHEKIKTN